MDAISALVAPHTSHSLPVIRYTVDAETAMVIEQTAKDTALSFVTTAMVVLFSPHLVVEAGAALF